MHVSTPSWCNSLRLTDIISAVVVAASLLIAPQIITIIVLYARRGIVSVDEGG
jgi:hypothetical protein